MLHCMCFDLLYLGRERSRKRGKQGQRRLRLQTRQERENGTRSRNHVQCNGIAPEGESREKERIAEPRSRVDSLWCFTSVSEPAAAAEEEGETHVNLGLELCDDRSSLELLSRRKQSIRRCPFDRAEDDRLERLHSSSAPPSGSYEVGRTSKGLSPSCFPIAFSSARTALTTSGSSQSLSKSTASLPARALSAASCGKMICENQQ